MFLKFTGVDSFISTYFCMAVVLKLEKKKAWGQKYGVWCLLWIINLVCKFDLISPFFSPPLLSLRNFRACKETLLLRDPSKKWESDGL